jgi:hypothetical protein
MPGSALSDGDADVELVEKLATGIVPGCLPGNGDGPRETAMTGLPKMSCKETSQHLREALP